MNVHERIKERRKQLGFTADYVAENLGVSRATVYRYESADIENMGTDKLGPISKVLQTTPAYLMGWDDDADGGAIPSITPYTPKGQVPILGAIPAGIAALIVDDIEGYTSVDVRDVENHFALRVKGDSMINAGINDGDLVIIRCQTYAENGNIVACRINGDEATLKRFTQHGDTVILMPENPKYPTQIASAEDFETGNACIIGVAIEVKRSLL